jgi:hypothetical protein
MTGVGRTTIHGAMETGSLMWVDFGGHQVTMKPWLNRWKKKTEVKS